MRCQKGTALVVKSVRLVVDIVNYHRLFYCIYIMKLYTGNYIIQMNDPKSEVENLFNRQIIQDL